jgi:hypothetical protein
MGVDEAAVVGKKLIDRRVRGNGKGSERPCGERSGSHYIDTMRIAYAPENEPRY